MEVIQVEILDSNVVNDNENNRKITEIRIILITILIKTSIIHMRDILYYSKLKFRAITLTF